MLRFLSDEDFNALIVQGLLRRLPDLDIVGVQEIGLSGAEDPLVLERAAGDRRVLLTHDVNTMLGFANARIRNGAGHPGVVKVPQSLGIGRAINDLEYIAQVATPADLTNQFLHLPL